MKVLILGGEGFIGAEILRALMPAGFDCVGLGRSAATNDGARPSGRSSSFATSRWNRRMTRRPTTQTWRRRRRRSPTSAAPGVRPGSGDSAGGGRCSPPCRGPRRRPRDPYPTLRRRGLGGARRRGLRARPGRSSGTRQGQQGPGHRIGRPPVKAGPTRRIPEGPFGGPSHLERTIP